MNTSDTMQLQETIKHSWEAWSENRTKPSDNDIAAIYKTISLLDSGNIRVATADDDSNNWTVHQWIKKAVLLSFVITPTHLIPGGGGNAAWWDKISPKTADWSEKDFIAAGFRFVPGALVRRGAHISANAVLMPSFVNIGAYVGNNTMIDTWATVGSCAQIGNSVHISGGTGIGGVLEPLGARPVIIEDNVFIGARSEVAEGVIVRKGSVLAMGCFIGASTKIVDRESGKIFQGEVPPYSVVVPATLPPKPREDNLPAPALACVAIVKTVDERTRSKTSINDLLRH